MTTPTQPDDDRWTGGTLESGADPDTGAAEQAAGDSPAGKQSEGAAGAEIGLQGEPTTFEPEEESS